MGASCTQLLGSPLETRAASLRGSRQGIQACTSLLLNCSPRALCSEATPPPVFTEPPGL